MNSGKMQNMHNYMPFPKIIFWMNLKDNQVRNSIDSVVYISGE